MRMISALYIDNYRGFRDIFIKLSKVNFLVGENSSGKTSILKLIAAISSNDFWHSQSLRGVDADLSSFKDMGSDNERGRVRVAVLYNSREPDPETVDVAAISIVFSRGRSGDTSVDYMKCSMVEGGELIIKGLGSNGKYLQFLHRQRNPVNDEGLSQWAREDPPLRGYARERIGLIGRLPFTFLISYLFERAGKGEKNRVSLVGLGSKCIWTAPIRTSPRMVYYGKAYNYSPDGSHVPYDLRRVLKIGANKPKRTIDALNKFGVDSGLFDGVVVRRFGRESNAPFAIEVRMGDEIRNIASVGYGVSQVLPITIELLKREDRKFAHFMIQQPEVHLHPRAQAGLGELLFDVAESGDSIFMIETHSDFVIDRYRQKISMEYKGRDASEVARDVNGSSNAQVLFFESRNGVKTVHSIKIDHRGSYSEEQPESFRRFFFDEELRNLAI